MSQHYIKDRCRCFILLVTKYGRKKNYNTRPDKIELLPGTLLNFLQENADSDKIEYELEMLDSGKSISVTCVPGEIESIDTTVADLLKPIPTCKERLEVYNDKKWLSDGKSLQEGERVFVKLKVDQSEVEGKLLYRGSNLPDSKGILFGVELMDKKGNCNGSYHGQHVFKTEQDFAVFVPLHKIRRRREDWQKSTRLRADEDAEGLYQEEYIKCSLKMGERVVWMSDDGPEKGSVKWIGRLPGDMSGNITIGVEFDKPVGTGTGKYKDHRLFYTKQGHASLIPLMGLMKEEEFEDTKDVTIESSPEFMRQQKVMMDTFSKSAAQDRAYAGQDPKLLQGGGDQMPMVHLGLQQQNQIVGKYPGMATAPRQNAVFYKPDYQIKDRGPEACGLNPVYELSRLQEESTAPLSSGNKNTASSLGRSSTQEPDPDLTLESMVEVHLKTPLYGVIRWIGNVDGKNTAGLEMEDELSYGTDGTFKGKRYFTCPDKKALFVPLYKCTKDKRFLASQRKAAGELSRIPTVDIAGDVAPPEITCLEDFRKVCGKYRGIQGHHNSCYLDATLFSMFYFTTVFDFIFNRPPTVEDIPEYRKVQQVLKEGIVNPLRKYNYVGADKVLKLRQLLDKLGTVPGMMGEEKDPEEFLSALLTEIMRADPLLHLSSGEHTYFYQLFMEKDENLLLPTTQKLVELSFLQGNVKLKEIPSCLMIQMPRFGKDFKMFHRIVPSLQLDITDILENWPRDCIVCGVLAEFECKDCYQVHGSGLNTTAFCEKCVGRSHQHQSRRNHHPEPISTADDFLRHYEDLKADTMNTARQNGEIDSSDIPVPLPREVMELFAVICIQTSHYVSFVKCGSGDNAQWVFFDSMADRIGEQGGYNIPEIVPVPEFSTWLAESNFPSLVKKGDDKELPEHLRRILCDGYMCMYQSPTVMMYQ